MRALFVLLALFVADASANAIGGITFSNVAFTLPSVPYACVVSDASQPGNGYAFAQTTGSTATRSFDTPSCSGNVVNFGSASVFVDAGANSAAGAALVNIVEVGGRAPTNYITVGITGTYSVFGITHVYRPTDVEFVEMVHRLSIGALDESAGAWRYFIIDPVPFSWQLYSGDTLSESGSFVASFAIPVYMYGNYSLHLAEYLLVGASTRVDEPNVLALLVIACAALLLRRKP